MSIQFEVNPGTNLDLVMSVSCASGAYLSTRCHKCLAVLGSGSRVSCCEQARILNRRWWLIACGYCTVLFLGGVGSSLAGDGGWRWNVAGYDSGR